MSPLQNTFLHFPGIGPARQTQLFQAGITSWQQLLDAAPEQLPCPARGQQLKDFAKLNIQALQKNDLQFFVDCLRPEDRWRLLHACWQTCVFLDIETAGLERDDDITVISCWNGHRLSLFVNGENLEEFPDYALDIPMVVTFNGASFDIPVITRYFNLPLLPVPHVDLRWICHRCSLDGGLKAIERQLDIKRPQDLVGTQGTEAVELWNTWKTTHDGQARDKLLRYCAADTIALQHVAAKILEKQADDPQSFQVDRQEHWNTLDKAIPPPAPHDDDAFPQNSEQKATAQAHAPSDDLKTLQGRLKAFLNKKRTDRL